MITPVERAERREAIHEHCRCSTCDGMGATWRTEQYESYGEHPCIEPGVYFTHCEDICLSCGGCGITLEFQISRH